MRFENLEERMLYLRSLTDYKLIPGSYVIAMVDGRSFSSKIKNKFKKPFDEDFVSMMNQTAEYVCKNVSGCKFAYTQSDEISFIITDFDKPGTESFFGYRICKMQSIIASLATAKFNQLATKLGVATYGVEFLENQTLYEFDCKVWNVPTLSDAFGWILYRQRDCIRNSKQQAAQAFLPHSALMMHSADEQIAMLAKEQEIYWDEYSDDKKFGRFVYKDSFEDIVKYTNKKTGNVEETKCVRTRFVAHPGRDLSVGDEKENLLSKWGVPVLSYERKEEKESSPEGGNHQPRYID